VHEHLFYHCPEFNKLAPVAAFVDSLRQYNAEYADSEEELKKWAFYDLHNILSDQLSARSGRGDRPIAARRLAKQVYDIMPIYDLGCDQCHANHAHCGPARCARYDEFIGTTHSLDKCPDKVPNCLLVRPVDG